MPYLHWDEKTIADFSPHHIEEMYDRGYVFTRIGRGVMHQTRSARIDLSKFQLSSENRRILKKVETLSIQKHFLPYADYEWSIGKMAKDFYAVREAEFSANKVKEILTDGAKSNFNTLLSFSEDEKNIGYVIGFETENIFHYSYPFYDSSSKDTGLGMMLKAILWAKDSGKKYFYLGSLQRPTDTYKLQFAGIEWFTQREVGGFDGNRWQANLEEAKNILNKNSTPE